MNRFFQNFTQIKNIKFVVKKSEITKNTGSESSQDLTPELKKVAEKFKQIRIDSGYSNHEIFAYDNEINRVQYWRVEKGSNITLSTFFKLLKIHNITPEEFFKDFSEKP